MAGRIRREDIDTLRQRASIVDIVGDHTSLKRAGARMKGLCPFHSERTPSFTVNPADNLYFCFGCGAGGDIYKFLMDIEGLEFTEAVEQLARRTGYTIRYEEMSAGERRALGQRTKLVEVTRAALAFFRDTLYSDDGRIARDYLKERGFGKDDAEHFQVGYAPNDWDKLSLHLTEEKRFAANDVTECGLAVRNERGGLRDRFRGRLIFPVLDLSGEVIGFGGRILPGLDYGDFEPPKYYNSPETPLYKKTKVLYGIHEARSDIVRAESVLICEGYTDVMALHQAGYGNAVATCGTAVGPDHLRIVSRYANDVVLAFDSDEAGAKAATRAWEAARQVESDTDGAGRKFQLKVLVLPAGMDPADYVRTEGVDALKAAVDGATPVVPFVIRRTIASGDTDSHEGRIATLRETIGVLDKESDLALRRMYAEYEIARVLRVSLQFVQETARQLGVAIPADAGTDAGVLSTRRRGAYGAIAQVTSQRAQWQRDLLRIALQHPQVLPDEWFELSEPDFSHDMAQRVFRALTTAGGAGVPVTEVLAAAEDDEVRRKILEISMEDAPADDVTKESRDLAEAILADRLRAEADALRSRLNQLNYVEDETEFREVNTRIDETNRLLEKMRSREL